ncbi:MAG: hypothetical protein COA88_02110 [Kordia sp.]|nr:MAG: hypothetical protein COA88_02110 [Kordia sp.]
MFKSFSLLSFLFVLTLSVLAPPSVLLIPNDLHIVVGGFNDDEGNQEKDIEDIDVEENEDEKKEHFFSSLMGLNEALIIDKTTASIAVIEGISSYFFDIQLPPPEYTV